MVLRLVLDFVWRKRFAVLIVGFQSYVAGKMVLAVWPAADALPLAMAFGAFMAMLWEPFLGSRELYQLPVSRRTWWRAFWWLGTAGVSSIAVAAVSLARWSARSPLFSVSEISLIFVMSFLYCGLTMSVVATDRYRRWADAPATLRSLVTIFPINLALPFVPLLFMQWLPHRWRDVHPVAALLGLAAAVLTVRSYFHQPAIEARPSLRGAAARPAPAVGVLAAAPPGRASFVDRLTGWRLVFWDESRKYAIAFVTVIGLAVICWAVASYFRPVPVLVEFLRLADALPFSSRTAHITEPITWGFLFFTSSLIDSWMVTSLRPLRTLPMSSNRFACVPIALGFLAAVMLGLVMLALHLLVLRSLPVSARFDLFVAFAAVTALSQTIRFVTPARASAASMLGIAPVMVIWLVLGFSDTWSVAVAQSVMLFGGVVTLVLSFVVMRHSITRSSRPYRPRPGRQISLAR